MTLLTQHQRLLASRKLVAALRLLDDNPEDTPQWHAARRRSLARLGRFAEAAAAGERVLAFPAATAEDFFRQAQVLCRTGRWQEAAAASLQAVARSGGDTLMLEPFVEAALRQPELSRQADALLSRQGLAPLPLPPPDPAGAVLVPTRLPHYSRWSGDHPWIKGLLRGCDDIRFETPAPDPLALAYLPAALEFARDRFEELRLLPPPVTVEAAARYVASRFVSLLHPCMGGALDILPMAVESLGWRPYVLVFDYLPVLFQPFFPYEDTAVDEQDPFYPIVRHSLEQPLCRAIMTTYESSADRLSAFFQSETIARKCVLLNPSHSIDEADALQEDAVERIAAERQASGECVILFASSFEASQERLFLRGIVDALNAFLTLAERRTDVRLLLRAPLLATLSDRLREAVQSHPRIECYPDRLPGPDYRRLFERASVFLLPAATAYRNGLAQAMGWGLVPVLSDGPHTGDMVEDGVSGIIVPGRAHLSQQDGTSFRQEWMGLMQATDRPFDPAFNTALVDALDALASDPGRLARMSRNAMRAATHLQMTERDVVSFRRMMMAALGR